MSKTIVIAFANNKGGSGKTTTCSNVGCALAAMGKRVLLVDGDMQMNLTLSCFDEERAYRNRWLPSMPGNSMPITDRFYVPALFRFSTQAALSSRRWPGC